MSASIENNATTKKCFTPPTGLNIVKGAGVSKKPLPNFNISDFENDSDEVIQLNESGTLEKYDHLRITKEKDIPKPDPIITIAGAKVAVAGNITSISAESKAGKTAVCGVILAGAISKTGIIDGFTDLVVKPNSESKAVIHLDTEQAAPDQQDIIIGALKRSGINTTPDFLYSYNIRQESFEKYPTLTNDICRLAAEKHNGIHLIQVDGGADYMDDANNETKSMHLIQYFVHLSIKYDCPIIVVVHLNPGGIKERGHFGSFIQRKCYGLLSITKEGNISTLSAKLMRKAGSDDIPQISFKYCKEKGYHVQTNSPQPADAKASRERKKLKEIAEKIFMPPTALLHKDAVSKIMNATSRKLTTAKTWLADMEGFGFINKADDGYYRLNIEKVNLGQNGAELTHKGQVNPLNRIDP